MPDAWIFARDVERATATAALLAELGFSPRNVSANGALRPDDGGSAVRPPELALVIDDRALCLRLREDEALADVPVLLTVDQEGLAGELPPIDELLVLPFTAAELGARIVRARQQLGGAAEAEVVRLGMLEVNLVTYQVTIAGRPIDFTYKEYELLRFLITHPGRVFSREALLNRVWGYDYYGGARTVDVHIRRVRAKLGQEHAARITTVRGVGYRFDR
jgi:DNA-binding response OmpR family regulator